MGLNNSENSNISDIKKEALGKIHNTGSSAELNKVYNAYLGKNGSLRNLLRSIKNIPVVRRPQFAKDVHGAISALEDSVRDKKSALLVNEVQTVKRSFDITMPGIKVKSGHLHPLTLVERRIDHIFSGLGFSVVEGPEIEDGWYNFDALNIPDNHPARDLWDTFWLTARASADTKRKGAEKIPRSSASVRRSSALLLRTHTSPMQVRYMETHQPPFRIIVPGRVYRFEATDASHELQFNQVEGLMVGEDISVANFKYIIEVFFEHFFRKRIKVRLRSSYFPFTEPSFEVDINCLFCSGKGCSTCGRSGWLEMGGAGIVHPKVFAAVKYDPKAVQGFAFGFGVERLAMMKYKIPDIRLFNSGDIRLSEQF